MQYTENRTESRYTNIYIWYMHDVSYTIILLHSTRRPHWLAMLFDNFDFQFQTNCYACNIDRSYTLHSPTSFEKPRIVRMRRNVYRMCIVFVFEQFQFNFNSKFFFSFIQNLWVFILVGFKFVFVPNFHLVFILVTIYTASKDQEWMNKF